MPLKNFIKVYQVIKSPVIISKCIRFLNKKFDEKKFQDGQIWTGKLNFTDTKVRDVQSLPLSNASESLSEVHWNNFLTHFIISGMNEYVREFPDIKKATIIEIQALRYGVGGHYRFHVDDGPNMNRKYSSILILNNDYEGGELCFEIDGKIEKIKNTPGSLIVWPSNFMFPHAVQPLTKGVRYSVVSWMN